MKYLILLGLLVLSSCLHEHVQPDVITVVQVGISHDKYDDHAFVRGAYLNGDVVYIEDPDAYNQGKYTPGQRINVYRQQ